MRPQLEVIEDNPQLLKALEILLGNDVSYIRAYFSNPSLLVLNLRTLLERVESAEDVNSAERSGG